MSKRQIADTVNCIFSGAIAIACGFLSYQPFETVACARILLGFILKSCMSSIVAYNRDI